MKVYQFALMSTCLTLSTLIVAAEIESNATQPLAPADVQVSASTLMDSVLQGLSGDAAAAPSMQELRARILNTGQFVEHPQGAQSYYLPPQQQQAGGAQSPAEVIQLQVPGGTDEKKIVLHLPPQHYPQQPHFQYRIPPRKHYKIILVRSPPAPTPPPAPVQPEVEERTLIYVLVKKPDVPSAEELQKLQQESVKFNKPEVYFIKYKANEQPTASSELPATNTNGLYENAAADAALQQQSQQPQQQQQSQQTSPTEPEPRIRDIIARQIKRVTA